MWFQVSLLTCLCLLMPGGGRSQAHEDGAASMLRSNDRGGRCQYTFTVASPEESSCPGGASANGGGAEMQGVVSRLTLLEATVSRMLEDRAEAKDEEGLQEAYSQIAGEKSELQRDKEQLSRQVQELQKRVDQLSHEAESLKRRPCQQMPGSSDGGAQHEPSHQTPASGENIQ